MHADATAPSTSSSIRWPMRAHPEPGDPPGGSEASPPIRSRRPSTAVAAGRRHTTTGLARTRVSAVLAMAVLAGCGAKAPAPAPPSPTFGLAPRITDQCARIDTAALETVLGVAGLHGVASNLVVGTVEMVTHSCLFRLPRNAEVRIGVAPVGMVANAPGADNAMISVTNDRVPDATLKITGVGDLAYYEPLGSTTTFQLVAVKGGGLRWYAVAIGGYDPTPGHAVLGKLTQDQLIGVAKSALKGL